MKLALKKIMSASASKKLLYLLVIVGIFEFIIALSGARSLFPEIFDGYSCDDILSMRPWYAEINLWLYFWLASTPIIILSFAQNVSTWMKFGRIIFMIALSYSVLNLTAHWWMMIKNAPFHGEGIGYVDDVLVTSQADVFKHNCFDIKDSFLSAMLFGWIPASLYVGFWLLMRYITCCLLKKIGR